MTDENDLLKRIERVKMLTEGNPFPEGTPEARAYALGWDMGRQKLVTDVTTTDPEKIVASFTKHYILMKPETFETRCKLERAKGAKEAGKKRKP